MPDIVRLRYLGDTAVAVSVVGREVEPDCIIDFPGVVVEEADDHYLIDSGNPPERRAWPRSRWANETPAGKKTKADKDAEE